jgi:hypothetical protein
MRLPLVRKTLNRFLCLIGCSICLVAHSRADTFQLANGKSLDGQVVRAEGSRITIRTASGVSTYDVTEFATATRRERFAAVDAALQKALAAQQERQADAASAAKKKQAGQAIDHMTLKLAGKPGWAAAGIGFWVVGWLWFVIEGFAQSALWGIAILLFNVIGGLAFLVLFPDRAVTPFLLTAVGVIMTLAGLFM